MSYATRGDMDALERRLARAEQTILRQEGQIKLLQARLDAAAPSDFGGAFRDRSRTPRSASASWQPDATGPLISLSEFALNNGLDDKCVEALQSQSQEVQNHVISQGPVEGRNPSAMVMSRIAKSAHELMAQGGGHGASAAVSSYGGRGELTGSGEEMDEDTLEEFILSNGLDEKAADSLRNQSPECQMAVISHGPADGRNSSAMVMGRIAKYIRGDL
mmetsp:Transcript_88101/g.205016  ORF Transcript_88101/g.205016 Transcript_88101/m.205016 type:complete len:218 (+) Transcript_88101:97-750(+)